MEGGEEIEYHADDRHALKQKEHKGIPEAAEERERACMRLGYFALDGLHLHLAFAAKEYARGMSKPTPTATVNDNSCWSLSSPFAKATGQSAQSQDGHVRALPSFFERPSSDLRARNWRTLRGHGAEQSSTAQSKVQLDSWAMG